MPVVITYPLGLQYSGSWSLSSIANARASSNWPYPFAPLYGWGRNQYGQLGLDNRTTQYAPALVDATQPWKNIAEGSTFTLASKADGTLWSWGDNASVGALGLGNRTRYSSPKQVGSLTNWDKVTAGYLVSFAIKQDGTLWAWGQNSQGQLGLGNLTDYSSPKQVGSLTNWLSISCGSYSPIAIKTDGTLWMWGANTYGQLGTGNTTDYSSPKQIGTGTNWAYGASSQSHTIAVKTDGTIWAWGRGNFGQLGLGTSGAYANRSSPNQIGALTNWLTASAGNYFSLATKTTGTAWSWGRNQVGQLGLNNTTYRSSPNQIGALTDWLKVAASRYQSAIALKTDGTLWGWGQNSYGEAATGSSPQQIGSSTKWTQISIGSQSSMGLQSL